MLELILSTLLNAIVKIVNEIFNAVMSSDVFSMVIFGLNSAKPELVGMENLAKIFDILGYTVLFIGAMIYLMKLIGTPVLGERSSNPVKAGGKLILSAALIVKRAEIFNLLLDVTNKIHNLFVLGWGGDSTLKITPHISLDITANLIGLGFTIALTIALLGAVVTYVERTISVTIYLCFYPLAMGFAACEEGMETFIDWLKGYGSQILSIFLSYALMYIGLSYAKLANGEAGFSLDLFNIFENTDMIRYFVIALVLLNASKNVEKLLAMFNIRTMKQGDAASSIKSAMTTALGMTIAAGKMGMSAVGKGVDMYSHQRHLSSPGYSTTSQPSGGTAIPNYPNGQPVPGTPGANGNGSFMGSSAARTAETLVNNGGIKFDKDGQAIMPNKASMREMAEEAGIIMPNSKNNPIIGIQNARNMSTFTQQTKEYAESINTANQNLKSELTKGSQTPTVPGENGTTREMTNQDLAFATNMNAIKNITPKNEPVIAVKTEYGDTGYLFTGVDKNGNDAFYVIGNDTGPAKNKFTVTDESVDAFSNNTKVTYNADREGGFNLGNGLYAYKIDRNSSVEFNGVDIKSDDRGFGTHEFSTVFEEAGKGPKNPGNTEPGNPRSAESEIMGPGNEVIVKPRSHKAKKPSAQKIDGSNRKRIGTKRSDS